MLTAKSLTLAILLSTASAVSPALAQDGSETTAPDDDARAQASQTAQQVEALMADLEARAASFPEVLQALAEGRSNIEQADQTVQDLIERLTEVTDNMQDGSAFDDAIDAYKQETQTLIAEAEASDNDAIRGMAPTLRDTLRGLDKDDRDRAETVIEARNVIAALEENREAIAFFIRAGEVQQAAELISTNVGEFTEIVARGREIANGLIDAASN